MRVLVTGSRDWNLIGTIKEELLRVLVEMEAAPHQITVVHGGARGADKIAGSIAASIGMNVEVFPAQWNTYGKRAGYLRNAEMVNSGPAICLAFIKDQSRGATMCADLAEDAGIETRRFTA
jgi:hypothetical protein